VCSLCFFKIVSFHHCTNHVVFVQLCVGSSVRMEVCAKNQTLAPVQRVGWADFVRSVSTHTNIHNNNNCIHKQRWLFLHDSPFILATVHRALQQLLKKPSSLTVVPQKQAAFISVASLILLGVVWMSVHARINMGSRKWKRGYGFKRLTEVILSISVSYQPKCHTNS